MSPGCFQDRGLAGSVRLAARTGNGVERTAVAIDAGTTARFDTRGDLGTTAGRAAGLELFGAIGAEALLASIRRTGEATLLERPSGVRVARSRRCACATNPAASAARARTGTARARTSTARSRPTRARSACARRHPGTAGLFARARDVRAART
jgi:hypothetical protein